MEGSLSYSGGNSGFKILIIGLLLLIGFGSVGIYQAVSQHALEKHSYDAVIVDSCLQNGAGYLGTFKRGFDGRILKVCQVDTDKFGVKVQEGNGDPVTDFIKEKLKRIDQVIRYVMNRGYVPHDETAINLVKTLGR